MCNYQCSRIVHFSLKFDYNQNTILQGNTVLAKSKICSLVIFSTAFWGIMDGIKTDFVTIHSNLNVYGFIVRPSSWRSEQILINWHVSWRLSKVKQQLQNIIVYNIYFSPVRFYTPKTYSYQSYIKSKPRYR